MTGDWEHCPGYFFGDVISCHIIRDDWGTNGTKEEDDDDDDNGISMKDLQAEGVG